MKKILFIFIFSFFSFFSFSQIYKSEKADKIIPGSDLIRYKEFSKFPNFIHFNQSQVLDKAKALELCESLFAKDNLKLVEKYSQKNKNGDETFRYQQTYMDIPIEFTSWSLQVKSEMVFALSGDLFDDLNIVSEFVISPDEALQMALKYVSADKYMWEDNGEENMLKTFYNDETATYYPKAEKVFVPVQASLLNKDLHSAYKFDIYSKKPIKRQDIYVDATSGEILFSLSKLYETDVVGTAHTQYSGVREINTEQTSGQFILNDNTRGNGIRTLNCHDTDDYNSATDFYDGDNIWNNINPQLDQYATDAHFATAATYDYYYNVHNRNSINGSGHQLWSYVHFSLIDYGYSSNVNAFWNGSWMTYGDGADAITPLTTVDICGHEITHGLTSYTANLVYQDEPGALNEAFSDIFGTAVEFYAVPEYADYLIGEDIGYVMRSIQNPNSTNKPDTYQGTYWWHDSGSDYGGVHTNGIPLCYGFYLLCEGGNGNNDIGNYYNVQPIGMEKAEQIFFRLLTVYLSPTSNYQDAWFFAMQAAADLYGVCSDEVKSVGDMFYAIGVAQEEYVNEAHAQFTAYYTQNCSAPFTVNFINQSYNSEVFVWNFGDGQTSTQINPSHTYLYPGFYDVKLTISGGGDCGSDVELKENFVQIDESLPCMTIFPTSGHTTINECSGIIFDSGGPNGKYLTNTNSYLTIYAQDATSIVLNIIEFDIEEGSESLCNYDFIAFYDGPNDNYPLINGTRYCNTTGNPNTIISSGDYITIQFYSDPGLALEGFKIQFDCINLNTPPIPYFSVDKNNSCDGYISFTDNSINNPQMWNWDFGDGYFSQEQNPVHKYLNSGTFTVKLEVSNENGTQSIIKNNLININLPQAPELIPIPELCIDQDFIIEQSVEGSLRWFESQTSEEPIYVGNTWQHEAIHEPVTYWVDELLSGVSSNLGSNNYNIGGGFFGNAAYIHYLIFDAYQPFILKTAKVNAQGAGDRVIALRNENQQVIAQKTVYCINGVQVIDLDFDVPQGSNLQLAGLGAPNLFRNDNSNYVNYPYKIDDVLSIKSSSAGTDAQSYYYFFYNWKIQTYDCLSERVEYTLNPEVCSNTNNTEQDYITVYPNPSKGVFKVINNENLTSFYEIYDLSGKILLMSNSENQQFDISKFADGIYFLKITLDSGVEYIKLLKQ